MKILIVDASSNRPLANTKIQLQVKGKDAGFLSVTSDASGNITLEDKLSGQQIAATTSAAISSDASAVKFVTATEGARLTLAAASAKGQTTETTQGGHSSK